ncbi:MAG: hypothetical protein QF363_07335 [Planctomycetaceae bacterium]|nr:hypothetical protein [Planctomycetaceae bacterium]
MTGFAGSTAGVVVLFGSFFRRAKAGRETVGKRGTEILRRADRVLVATSPKFRAFLAFGLAFFSAAFSVASGVGLVTVVSEPFPRPPNAGRDNFGNVGVGIFFNADRVFDATSLKSMTFLGFDSCFTDFGASLVVFLAVPAAGVFVATSGFPRRKNDGNETLGNPGLGIFAKAARVFEATVPRSTAFRGSDFLPEFSFEGTATT